MVSRTAHIKTRLAQSAFKYATPGYEGPPFEQSGRHRIVTQGESSSYAKKRENIVDMKKEISRQQKRYASVLKKERPVIPNRLNNHAHSMRALSKMDSTGYFGYGPKDQKELYKGMSNFESVTKGQIKSLK